MIKLAPQTPEITTLRTVRVPSDSHLAKDEAALQSLLDQLVERQDRAAAELTRLRQENGELRAKVREWGPRKLTSEDLKKIAPASGNGDVFAFFNELSDVARVSERKKDDACTDCSGKGGRCDTEVIDQWYSCDACAGSGSEAAREKISDLQERAESAELGCEIAYEREPTQKEGDAHEAGKTAHAKGECFVSMGGHTGRRCRVCNRWVWGGPTACVTCVVIEERAADRAEIAQARAELDACVSAIREFADDALGLQPADVTPDELLSRVARYITSVRVDHGTVSDPQVEGSKPCLRTGLEALLADTRFRSNTVWLRELRALLDGKEPAKRPSARREDPKVDVTDADLADALLDDTQATKAMQSGRRCVDPEGDVWRWGAKGAEFLAMDGKKWIPAQLTGSGPFQLVELP